MGNRQDSLDILGENDRPAKKGKAYGGEMRVMESRRKDSLDDILDEGKKAGTADFGGQKIAGVDRTTLLDTLLRVTGGSAVIVVFLILPALISILVVFLGGFNYSNVYVSCRGPVLAALSSDDVSFADPSFTKKTQAVPLNGGPPKIEGILEYFDRKTGCGAM